jgi:hypothetical protein
VGLFYAVSGADHDPPKCGKTLIQEKIISPLLGCGPTDATSYLTNGTDFNQDLIGSFHWMISDGLAFKPEQQRLFFQESVCAGKLSNDSSRIQFRGPHHSTYRPARRT